MSCNYAEGLSPYPDKGQVGMPERFAGKEEVSQKVAELAALMKASRHTVFHTGAGISTSAGIPDFRGPKGVWTLEKKGLRPDVNVSFDDARPTYTHMALVALEKAGLIQYLVTQNIDGLHLRSGFPRRKMAELHGNMYLDKCSVCKREFVRCSAVSTVGQKSLGVGCPGKRDTGRRCRGRLHDNILDWEHDLPHFDYNLAEKHSVGSDLSVCLGTTLQIIPSGVLPTLAKQSGGKLVICNLQPTKHDKISDIIINGYVDDVMRELLSLLNITCLEYSMEQDPVLITRALKTKLANSSDAELIEWTIPDSWFDDKDLIEKVSRNKAIADQKNLGKKYPRATKIDRKKRKSPIKTEVKKEETGECSSQDECFSARNERYRKRSLDAGQLETNKRKKRTSDSNDGALNSSLNSDFNVGGVQRSQNSPYDSDFSRDNICELQKSEDEVISSGNDGLSPTAANPVIASMDSNKNPVEPLTNELDLTLTKKEDNATEEQDKPDAEMLPVSDILKKNDEGSTTDELIQRDILQTAVNESSVKNSDNDSTLLSSEACSVSEKVELNEVCCERTFASKASPNVASRRAVAGETVEDKVSFSKSDTLSANDATVITNTQTSSAQASIYPSASSLVHPLETQHSTTAKKDIGGDSGLVQELSSPVLPAQNAENVHVVKRPIASIPSIVSVEKLPAKSDRISEETLNSSNVAERSDLKSRNKISSDSPNASLMLDENNEHSEMSHVGACEESPLKSVPDNSSCRSTFHPTVEPGTPKYDASPSSLCKDDKSFENLSSLLPQRRAIEHGNDSRAQFEYLSSQKAPCGNLKESASNIVASKASIDQKEINSSQTSSEVESRLAPPTNANGSHSTPSKEAFVDSANGETCSGSRRLDSDVVLSSSSKTFSSTPSASDNLPLLSVAPTIDPTSGATSIKTAFLSE
ncbi:Sirtuin family [Trinorchestia longiramus]|nr:Sirtuin family [Trinorchestia longiramus]